MKHHAFSGRSDGDGDGDARALAGRAGGAWAAGGHVRLGLLCLVLLVAGLGGWAATARLEGAVIAPGKLQVERRRQVVQHPDGGVVAEILVREGDVVAAGEPLVRLDGTAIRSELAVLESELYELIARRGRLEAEMAGRGAIRFAPELRGAAGADADVRALLDGQQALFEARRDTMEREIEAMRAKRAQIEEQVAGLEVQMGSLGRQRALIEEELEAQRRLLAKGLAQASRVLALEREAAQIDGERGRLTSESARLASEASGIDIEVLRLGAARREEAIATLRDLGVRELELRERRIALRERLSWLELRAPVGGVVLEMGVHALRAVIRPAEPVLHIVPTASPLVVAAEVGPSEIDSVRPGQEAVLRFPAFNARTTPELRGIVSKVSPDALLSEQTGRDFYRAEVLLSEGEVARLDGRRLVAGMPVEVFIRTGARTPLEYLLKPVTDYLEHAMREN